MVKHRIRGKNKSILDYLSSSGRDDSVKIVGKPSMEKAGEKSSSTIYDELLRIVEERKKVVSEKSIEKRSVEEVDVSFSEPLVPSGKVLDEILYKGLGSDDIKCDQSGVCSDGKRIGEVFVDKYGFKRQRGFVNTTRLPIFLDWIVEEAVVQEILPRAYSVRTNRGSIALIPEDFLCELHTRYGIILKNYDKCKNYKPGIGVETTRTKRRKR